MRQFHEAEQLAARDGLTFAEAMRMLAGAAVTDDVADVASADWSSVTAGPWLAETLQKLRTPNGSAGDVGAALDGVQHGATAVRVSDKLKWPGARGRRGAGYS